MRTLVAAQFPSRADCNPYVQLLTQSLAEWGVRTHEHDLFVDGIGHPYPEPDPAWLFRHQGRVNMLHFHWLQKFYRASTEAEARERLAHFTEFLSIAKELDYRIAYSFHNLLPHEGMGEEMDLEVRRLVISHADLITCFSNRQKEFLLEKFGPMPLEVIPHPNYIGYYPNNISRKESRERLGLPHDARVFTYLGLIRPYKEVDCLIKHFTDLDIPNSHLILAGVSLDEDLGRYIESVAQGKARIHPHFRWIADDEVQVFLNACDAVVLPYSHCWSSGATLLSFSFGRPVITADPMLIDDPTGLGFFYSDQSGLGEKIAEAAESELLEQMGEACLDYASKLPWSQFGRRLAAAYLSACSEPTAARNRAATGGAA